MNALTIGLLIFLTYTIVAVNTCAIARAKYWPTAISSALFIVANFFLIRYVASATTIPEFAGYLVGGVAGDLAGLYISQRLHIV